MRYIKLFETFYVGKQWTSGKGGRDALSNNVVVPMITLPYDDEDVAYNKGYDAFELGDTENPYELEQYPNPNLVVAWQQGFKTAEKNSHL
jgi:hypothetical protein